MHFTPRGRSALLALLTLTLVLGSEVPAARAAGTGDRDAQLSESGILYPQGFDANTVGEVTGKATGLQQPRGGPVRFQLAADGETYTVLACPAWYWNDLETSIPDGTVLRARGSKTLGRDGNLYIIAQQLEILSSGNTLVLRNDLGFPLWRGPRGGGGGAHGHGGAGPSQGGAGGGFGGGPGGRGFGRGR